jgi:nicotinamidase/pyrazinamidase
MMSAPRDVKYDQKTALIVVDVQNDFADPRGSLYVTEGEAVVPRINREVNQAFEAGAGVFYTQDWHPPATPHFQKDGGIWPVHCVQETWGAQFHPDLHIRGEVVRKGTRGEDGYSGFTVRDPRTGREDQTTLEARLRDRDTEQVVVVGLATDYCVKATAIDAATRGFQTIALRAAMCAVDLQPGDGERAIAEMRLAGVQID